MAVRNRSSAKISPGLMIGSLGAAIVLIGPKRQEDELSHKGSGSLPVHA
jgi:hypothetical protein